MSLKSFPLQHLLSRVRCCGWQKSHDQKWEFICVSVSWKYISCCFFTFINDFLSIFIGRLASNQVPPSVSKRIKLQIHCKYWISLWYFYSLKFHFLKWCTLLLYHQKWKVRIDKVLFYVRGERTHQPNYQNKRSDYVYDCENNVGIFVWKIFILNYWYISTIVWLSSSGGGERKSFLRLNQIPVCWQLTEAHSGEFHSIARFSSCAHTSFLFLMDVTLLLPLSHSHVMIWLIIVQFTSISKAFNHLSGRSMFISITERK